MYTKVNIQGLVLDPISERPILLLKSEECGRLLPIWIGTVEANAIALEMEKVPVPRPMTHDLLRGILDVLEVPIRKVLICDLKENTYFASIILMKDNKELQVDARPSDAVALALRAGAPIYVHQEIFDRCAEVELAEEPTSDQLRKWLETLGPEELGHYKM